jgi:hypothetical protein
MFLRLIPFSEGVPMKCIEFFIPFEAKSRGGGFKNENHFVLIVC